MDVALLGVCMFLGLGLAFLAGDLIDEWWRNVSRKTQE